jgi:hypothetical protein
MIRSAYISYFCVLVSGWIGFNYVVFPGAIIIMKSGFYSTNCLILQKVLKLEKYTSDLINNKFLYIYTYVYIYTVVFFFFFFFFVRGGMV